MARKISNFPAFDTPLLLVEFCTLFRIQVQDQASLENREDQALISIATILKFPAQIR